MTKVKIFKMNGNIFSFKITGHAGKDVYGKDILCSAISALSQSAVVGINEVLKFDCEKEIKEGYLFFKISEDISKIETVKAVLNTFEKSIEGLIEGNEKYMLVEVKDEN